MKAQAATIDRESASVKS